MILCEDDVLQASDLPGRLFGREPGLGLTPSSDLDHMSLADAVAEATERLEKRMILSRLKRNRSSRTETAKSLGVSRKTLFNKMRQYGLSDDDLDESGPVD